MGVEETGEGRVCEEQEREETGLLLPEGAPLTRRVGLFGTLAPKPLP